MRIKPSPATIGSLPYADLVSCAIKHNFADWTDKALIAALKENNATELRLAIIKELIWRIKGLSLFDTQLSTAYSLLNSRIAELPTGEGKTLAAVVAAICYVLDGHRVHVLVFNDYLAKRDWSENRSIYKICGLSVGFVDQHSTIKQRKAAYACDVTYVSAKQAGFDYLRDFMAQIPDEVVFPQFDVAIVDEADSIMIDECITPLVLAGETPHERDITKGIDEFIRVLIKDEYELSLAEHQVWLTEKGISHAEEHLGLNIYEEENMAILCGIQNALEAHLLLTCDKDYIIKDGAIQLVEPTTGRVVINKRYPDLLHRAVEVKEGLEPAPLTMIYNSITMQNFLKQYKTLCGMTGTAATSAKEIKSTYDLTVDVIPPHTPSIRTDYADTFFTEQDDFLQSVIDQISDCYARKQPVLIGTKSVSESEQFSELLCNVSIPHNVLNAKNDDEEAKLIAEAGKPGNVTISTNMAGRGVDIRLGGTEEELRGEAITAGGLFVIGVGANLSLRIDNQLRGRAGRQGDPGQSKFFIWLEDTDLSCRMTPLEKVKAEIGSTGKRINTVRRVQRQMEGEAAEARYSLSRFSDIVEQQRVRLSELRTEILNGNRYFAYLETANPGKYQQVLHQAGIDGIKRAEQQLALYYINKHWAECLDTLESIRRSIHFMVLGHDQFIFGGQGNTLDQYSRIVINLRNQMSDNIKQDILSKMETMPITSDGINMKEAGLCGGTTTWTYAIDESIAQFTVLRNAAKNTRDKFSGEEGILTNYYRKKRGGNNRNAN